MSKSAYLVCLMLLLAASPSSQQLSNDTGSNQPEQHQQSQPPNLPPISRVDNSTSQQSPPIVQPTPTTTTTTSTTTTTTSTTSTTTQPPSTLSPIPYIDESRALPLGSSEAQPETKSQVAPQVISSTSAPSASSVSDPVSSPSPTPLNVTTSSIDGNVTTNSSDVSQLKKEPLLDGVKTIIDLSHPLNNNTINWPTQGGFQYLDFVDGERINGHNRTYYVKSDGFKMAVHTGTHLDAPRHFGKYGWTVEQIPLERLVDVPMQVIDLSEVVRLNRTYQFTREDFIDQKTKTTLIKSMSVVLVYTGISESYNDGKMAYYGGDYRNISEMRIPGFSPDAAKLMVEVGVYGVGLDAPSADSSTGHLSDGSYDLVAHDILNSNNIYILENINGRLKELVENKGVTARLTATPLPITGGSGSPVRLIAVTVHNDCPMALNSGFSALINVNQMAMISTILVSLYLVIILS